VQVCELSTALSSSSTVMTDITCNCVHTFHSGSTQKVLARSRLVLPSSGELLVCAGDEASLAVKPAAASYYNCLIPASPPVDII